MLKRKVTEQLQAWHNDSADKALFVKGARQIGKSFAIREFGKLEFDVFIEINLLENSLAKQALSEAASAKDFISAVSILAGQEMAVGRTLVFIDEIQEAPDVLTMAKFLVEDGRFAWAFSGSMLGTEFKNVRSYPVGYVHEITMRPMDFEEFAWAIGVSAEAFEKIREACLSRMPVEDYIHQAMLANLRTYIVVGGMPEVVSRFIESQGDLAAVRALQTELTVQYRHDISKYAGNRSLNVQAIFDQLPVHLEGDARRFVLNSIDPQARFEKYQQDFVWLVDAGVGLKTTLANELSSPLARSVQEGNFKLYQSDTGMLLSRYAQSVAQAVYFDDKSANLGGIYENYVAQELVCQGRKLYYHQTRKRGEIDFALEPATGGVVPVEVKSGSYFHAHAAVDNALEAEGNSVKNAVVLSKGNVEQKGQVLYVPLYATYLLPELLGEADLPAVKLDVQLV